jgi:rhodanese-related sulfurtransferase
MKELEKTKRISIAAVLSILLLVVGLLNYKRPLYLYSQNSSSTLDTLLKTDYLVPPAEVGTGQFVLVDIRSSFEYDKGHLPDAINVYAPELLSEENSDMLLELSKGGKTLLLYGNDPDEALPAFMMLSQLGIGPAKIMEARNYFEKDELKTVYAPVEADPPAVKEYIEASAKKAAQQPKVTVQKSPPPKKVIPAKKKKKKMPEGGC